MTKARVGILISGTGSNMEALIRAAEADDCPYAVAVVISNRPDAAGLERARALGVTALAVDHAPFGKDREAHEHALDAALRRFNCHVVALAGYMRIMTPFLVGAWEGRMLNIHPSLLPRHPGLDTHRRAIEAGDAEAGCSVHLVTAGVDEGPVLAQARTPITETDSVESLTARVLAAEHALYPRALAEFVRSRAV
ncbi:phosphoribosylglycinamide formyltransferase [Caulobacter sp. NIBR1757]|uniref:phosphoribosylglycinamide formyltransferase n=1 Tax=Caulobacter sp. NIBR1757 TaxID=3016000 RepID=UPI0022F0FA84|nr:phosphoribosylglycinamide formyltransferase [Caulobacter sp. NIBR1757]WGM39194.1 Phosphoribosylglycinamide formyltransferase [Caulobacter sp. NIBR1757]